MPNWSGCANDEDDEADASFSSHYFMSRCLFQDRVSLSLHMLLLA